MEEVRNWTRFVQACGEVQSQLQQMEERKPNSYSNQGEDRYTSDIKPIVDEFIVLIKIVQMIQPMNEAKVKEDLANEIHPVLNSLKELDELCQKDNVPNIDTQRNILSSALSRTYELMEQNVMAAWCRSLSSRYIEYADSKPPTSDSLLGTQLVELSVKTAEVEDLLVRLRLIVEDYEKTSEIASYRDKADAHKKKAWCALGIGALSLLGGSYVLSKYLFLHLTGMSAANATAQTILLSLSPSIPLVLCGFALVFVSIRVFFAEMHNAIINDQKWLAMNHFSKFILDESKKDIKSEMLNQLSAAIFGVQPTGYGKMPLEIRTPFVHAKIDE